MENKPTRPPRAKRKQSPQVSDPLSKEDKETFKEPDNKYAPKQKVGRPQLRSPITVNSVGLGGLEVTTATGIKK